MYKTFLNDIFSDDNEDIKVRLDTTPRTDNYNRIAAANTPDYAAGLGALSNHFDNKNNALQTQLDFAKNKYNQSNKKVLLDAILAHERGLQNDRFAHEKTMKKSKYDYLNNKRTAEHSHLMNMLIEKNKGDLATTEAQYKPKVMEQNRLFKELEAKLKTDALKYEDDRKMALLDKGYYIDENGKYVKMDSVQTDGGFTQNPQINNNSSGAIPNINTTNTPIQQISTKENIGDNTTTSNSYADDLINIAKAEAQQEEKKKKNIIIDNTQHNVNEYNHLGGYLPGIHPNAAQQHEQKNAYTRGYDKLPKQSLNKLDNLYNYMKKQGLKHIKDGWNGLSADVLRHAMMYDINTNDYVPLINDSGELFYYNKNNGTIYSIDDTKGLIEESVPEDAGFLTNTFETVSQPINSLQNLGADIKYPVFKFWFDNNIPEKAKNAWETAYNWSDDMDKTGANLIDKVVNWFKKR